jgi:hypothetical protein
MPIQSVKNQYLGINAHLHSYWQARSKWNRFHNVHAAHLMQNMKAELLPMGYTADLEDSLQVRRLFDKPRRMKPDIYIRDLNPERSTQSASGQIHGTPAVTLDDFMDDEEDKEHPYSAVAIYERERNTDEPVAWIELLSPSNKGYTADARIYRSKRLEVLNNGVVFVELDYLHETPPTFWRMSDYTQGEEDSSAYRIVVLDPRPDFTSGYAYPNEFDVDTPIPQVVIPLNESDVLDFDFNRAYQETFEQSLYGYDSGFDYSALPLNFERYSLEDQTRIARRMLSVMEAVHTGTDLETGPFPVKEVSLEEALAQIEALRLQ